jgi:hypothetical protein
VKREKGSFEVAVKEYSPKRQNAVLAISFKKLALRLR